ncbi:DNA-binding protein HU [compost metagenome]
MTAPASRKDLIKYVAAEGHITQAEATQLVDLTLQGIVQLATHNDGLTIREFGRFEIRHRAPRVNRSGFGGKPTAIPPRTALAFTASPNLVQPVAE